MQPLEHSIAQMLPVTAGPAPEVDFVVDVDEPTTLCLELRASERLGNYTPNVTLGALEFELAAGPNQTVTADFDVSVADDQYLFYCLMANEDVHAHLSEQRLSRSAAAAAAPHANAAGGHRRRHF